LENTHLRYHIALTLLNGIGPIKAKSLLGAYNSPEELFRESLNGIQKKTGIRRSVVQGLQREKALRKADEVIEHLQKNNIHVLLFDDQQYPHRLRNCPDAPLILYFKGNSTLNSKRMVSIVGTRTATSYGKRICSDLIASLHNSDVTIVSGLALGIDACAHKLALEHSIPTIGVLGHGLDRIYPQQHRSLAGKMISNGGLLTEFIPGTDPDRENFPKRNRIVAGLCDATIVIESKQRGGSLITAMLANDYNRDVFAYPGNIYTESSLGCNQLIADQKAHLVQQPEDFLRLMGWNQQAKPQPAQKKLFENLSKDQLSIVHALPPDKAMQIDVLAIQTSMPITKLNTALFHLEVKGLVRSLPGNMYVMI